GLTFADFDDLWATATFGDFDVWAFDLPRLPAVDAATIDNLDPRQNLRVEVTLTRENVAPSMSTQTRVFVLYLHARHLNANDGTVELVCRSDEAILIDDVLGGIAVDAGAETYQASLRGIVNYVLAPFGAELEPGDADADFTLTEDGRDPDALKREPGERA